MLGRGIDPWKNILKIPTLDEALRQVTTPYVIATDSPDVIILREPGNSIELFERSSAELLYIGDSSFWPPEFQDLKAQEEQIPGARDTPFPYLNAGALIGRTEFCRHFFMEAAREGKRQIGIPYVEGTSGAGTDADDQSVMKRLYLANHPNVQLDLRCEIFQTLTYQNEDVLQFDEVQNKKRWWQRT
ncbi:MAG TPA: hypothetical protein VK988_05615 [Acidimicrobiales bacterium]|nr:hypothetical protein [Acidimicrobiales bacterium]